MTLLTVWGVLNYGLVLLYGLFLSVFIAGGWKNDHQRCLVIALCPVLLLIQAFCWLLLGEDTVRKLYPLIVHLPLMLILIFALEKPTGVAIVSVFTAYLCCQLPRWGNLAVAAMTHSELAGEIVYSLLIGLLFFLLLRYFVKPAHDAMTYSRQSLLLFGSLPAAYYVFDYSTTIYSDSLYAGIPALNELIPTALILFYVVFLAAYHHETQERLKAQLQSSAQATLFKQAQKEMDTLRQAQMQAAIYRHDMRHHLNMIGGFLDAGKADQALAYIHKTRDSITSVSVKQFCENEAVNLICSSFADKAARMEVRLTIQARLPEALTISDTELCAILSNGLENALHAVSRLEDSDRWITLYCGIKCNKLLIEIENPYAGNVTMEDGLPVTAEAGHGYGCRSIRAIVQQHGGLYTFSPENGIFTLQIALPLLSVK